MTAITHANLQNYPSGLRYLLGQHIACRRWNATCEFWEFMETHERATVCFHAGLGEESAVQISASSFSDLHEGLRERLVVAIDDLRAFASWRKHGVSNTKFLGWLTPKQRNTLFKHAGLSEWESMQPYCYIDKASCPWAPVVIRSMRELFHLFECVPSVLTAVKPEEYA